MASFNERSSWLCFQVFRWNRSHFQIHPLTLLVLCWIIHVQLTLRDLIDGFQTRTLIAASLELVHVWADMWLFATSFETTTSNNCVSVCVVVCLYVCVYPVFSPWKQNASMTLMTLISVIQEILLQCRKLQSDELDCSFSCITAGPAAQSLSRQSRANKRRRTSRPSTLLRCLHCCTFCLEQNTVSFLIQKTGNTENRMFCRWRSDGRPSVRAVSPPPLRTPGLVTQTQILVTPLPIPECVCVCVWGRAKAAVAEEEKVMRSRWYPSLSTYIRLCLPLVYIWFALLNRHQSRH